MSEPQPGSGHGRRRWMRGGLAALLIVALAVVVGSWMWPRMVAAVTVADALGISTPRPLAPDVDRQEITLDGITVDRYGPRGSARYAGSAPVVVLVPGAARDGRDDARVVDLARAVARADRIVLVPELEVYAEQLVFADVERLRRLLAGLSDRHVSTVLVGTSFGGSLSLLAASSPTVAQHLELVATFGAYADLGGVVQAATTGVSVVEAERIPWDPDPRAVDVVRDQLLSLLDSAQRARVSAALDGEVDPDDLSGELHALYDVLTNDDPARTPALLDQTPAVVRERIAEMSPSDADSGIDVPVIAMHALDDPVIPYGELARIGAVYEHAELVTLTSFEHVGVAGGDDGSLRVSVRDAWRTITFVTRVLSAGT